jgi:hypothetical protein
VLRRLFVALAKPNRFGSALGLPVRWVALPQFTITASSFAHFSGSAEIK